MKNETLEEIAARMAGQPNEDIALALAARCGKPVSRFFRNEARRLANGQPKWTKDCLSPKEEMDRAALAREYREDRK